MRGVGWGLFVVVVFVVVRIAGIRMDGWMDGDG